jgi:hypothetical protein
MINYIDDYLLTYRYRQRKYVCKIRMAKSIYKNWLGGLDLARSIILTNTRHLDQVGSIMLELGKLVNGKSC